MEGLVLFILMMYLILCGILMWAAWLHGRDSQKWKQEQDSCSHAHKSCDDCGQKGL